MSKKSDEIRMELFDSVNGLLFTMTTITPTFFAPERSIEHHALAKKTAWRPLLISGGVHVFGVILVVLLSQLSIDDQKARVNILERTAEIKARLYYPPMPRPQMTEDKQVERLNETRNNELKPDVFKSPQATDSKTKPSEKVEAHQEINPATEEQLAPVESKPDKTPPSSSLSNDVNRRAGSLNLSVKDGAARYFEEYNNNKLAEDAKQAAREFQEQKNSPILSGPSTQQIQAKENRRPSKRVNCSSTTNKTLAILSGIAGGSLKCTKMDDHKRFIDARVKKLPQDENKN
ncbi:hypothetical protein [Alteromonas sp. HB246098]